MLPASHSEIIVVDNNSSDQTKKVVDQMAEDSAVPLKYIFEGHLGLSRSRNAGIAQSRGDILAFIDDDATADPGWLRAIASTYSNHPDANCVGGKVVLRWKSPRPNWWMDCLDGLLSAVNFGEHETSLTYPKCPNGTNISFKKCVFYKYGTFDTQLGRIGKKLLGAEEIDLCLRIEKGGGKIYYSPSAVVYHCTHEYRLSRKYIYEKVFRDGRLAYYIENKNLFCSGPFGFKRLKRDVRYVIVQRAFQLDMLCSIIFNCGYLYQQLITTYTEQINT